ncbi:MAG: ATP synthase F1 subunit delta [Flavobacteriales bacterium]
MKGQRVAYRYAKSLLSLATEQNMLEQAFADMQLIADTCNTSKDFVVFLRSPVVKADKKISVINNVFSDKLSVISAGFIRIITTHRREIYLAEIANSFVEQYRELKKIATAEITTASPLDEKLRNRIREIVHQTEGREVFMIEKVDPGIIGGIIVKVGDRRYDGSIMRKLRQLRQDFSKNAYVSQL